jgi:hypothetical protein
MAASRRYGIRQAIYASTDVPALSFDGRQTGKEGCKNMLAVCNCGKQGSKRRKLS